MSLLLVSFLLAFTDPSASAPAPQAVTTEPARPAAKGEKKICKADESFTGSRFKKKICLTETEWANRSANTANDLKNMGAR